VHRATLHDGRAVAVKVQHPGIRRAVESDLANASAVESLVRVLGAGKLGSKEALAEIHERFLEELDYAREAEQQRWFAAFHASDPNIVVPAVIDDRSAQRVLTTELVRGRLLDDVGAEDGDAARREYARTLWRFVFRGNLVGGRFNADPHPGNYFFQGDGRVAFLDFGCVQHIRPAHQAAARDAHVAALARDEAAFRDAMRRMIGLDGGRFEEFALGYTRKLFEPLFSSPFRITRRFVAGIVEDVQSIKKELIRGRDTRFVPLPPGMLFMNRLQFGFYSVLARLDVEVDYAGEERVFLGS
jgi:predicted unusual protein kinase regulating ubiquinone biosynthesis (AarF/ABC1/UbiB family)